MKLKSIFYPLLIASLTSTAYAQVKIGSNPGTITPNALLDIEGSTPTTRTVSLANGNFGIGVTVPVAKLDVLGNVRIADGTQGAGKVLTSNANGVASWVNPSLALSGNTLSISGGNSVALPNQSLALSGNTLSISGGNSVALPNQSLALSGNTLSISEGNSVALPNQSLALSGNTLSISGGNSVALPVQPAQSLALSGNTLSISGGNSVALPVQPAQSLALSGNTLSISGGNSVALPNPSLALSGNTLSISGGNSVALPVAPDRVIASARQSQGQGFPPGSTQVDFISTEFESYGGTVDLQNDVIRVPRSGYYQIGGTIGLGDVSSDPNVVNTYKLSACIYYQVNGADFGENCIRNDNGSRQSGSFTLIKYLNQGDAISVRIVNVEQATFPGKGGFSDLQIMEIR